ncbi:competence/damage-inducible protein A [Ferrimonas marina]|uniref:CinA-like protein n=1 Tax=Ferrimonas marina TaxID=299255 RepID=A0A1M5XHH3_9GAMM|nr:competence/damage-inducible protein A [Ferrimonas marina]SHH99199.1 nicotinamide-nucleotide amidase [Ferrimonas marina]
MHFEMICTGEEVLSGQIVDTNAAWVAQRLLSHGVEMHSRVTLGDRMADLVGAFRQAAGRAQVVLVNGGLGPTEDDLSTEAMAQAMGVELELHQGWLETMTAFFERRGRPMAAVNRKQALLPAGAVMIDNPVGTACGFRVQWQGTWFVFTPGVPHELKKMVNDEILPWLMTDFGVHAGMPLHRILTIGQGESHLAAQLEELELPDGLDLGYRASLPYIELKLMQRRPVAEAALDKTVATIHQRIGDAWVGDNVVSVAEAVHQLMLQRQLSLVTAESCTGGMVASQLVDFAGSSGYLQGGWVTYSNQAKQQELGVATEVLEQHGAVSLQTAQAMAQGARSKLGSDLAISITGVAGPDGGSEEKPVGTVAFALAHASGCDTQLLNLGFRQRNQIRVLATTVALDMVRRHLLGLSPIAEYGYLRRVATL